MQDTKLDVNLLRVLDVLLEELSVSKAARRLGVTQPAVSLTLAKLRDQLGDPLFIRSSKGFLPTPFAETLRKPIRRAFNIIDGEIAHVRQFDPTTSKRLFRLATPDLGETAFMGPLISILLREAPNTRLETVSHHPRMLNEAIMRDDVDIAVGYFPELTGNGMHELLLIDIPLVCVARKGHALEHKVIDIEEFQEADHVTVGHETRIIDLYETKVKAERIKRKAIASLGNMTSLPPILADTDCLAVVPETILQKYAHLTAIRTTFELPSLEAKMYWHHRCHGDSANAWMRQKISDIFRVISSRS